MSNVEPSKSDERSIVSKTEKVKDGSDMDFETSSAIESTTPKSSMAYVSKKIMRLAYAVIILTAFVENFANDSTSSLDSYATSNFNSHSIIATVSIVYRITAIVSYPIMAKLADMLGRGEGFAFSVIFYTLAYVLYAACQNVETYVSGEIFFSIGKTGYKIFQQIFIADNSSLLNRGFLSQLPDALASIPSLYAGTYIMDAFLENSTWRWGYGCFGIVLAATFFPLSSIMFYIDKRALAIGERKPILIMENVDRTLPWYRQAFQVLFRELDIGGGLLLITGMTLFFIPFTLTGKASTYTWDNPKLITMLVVGVATLVAFGVWNFKFSKRPFVPPTCITNRSALIIVLLGAVELIQNSSFATYFITTLQVSGYHTAGSATRIDRAKKVTLDVTNVLCGLLMKYTKRSKLYILIGLPILLLGHGLLVWFMWKDNKVEKDALLIFGEVLIGLGRGLFACASQVIIQGLGGKEGIAMSTAFFFAFHSIGALIGGAISGGIWNTVVLQRLHRYLPEENQGEAESIYKNIVKARSYTRGTPARDAIARSYAETVQIIGWVGLGIVAPMLIAVWFIDDMPLTDDKDAFGDFEDSDEFIPEQQKRKDSITEEKITAEQQKSTEKDQ